MALTTQGSVSPEPNPQADRAAANVYASGSATRMARREGVVEDVSAVTPNASTAESSYASGAFKLGKATPTAHKAAGATISGSGTGFPEIGLGGGYPDTAGAA